jgi:hypothetical protein
MKKKTAFALPMSVVIGASVGTMTAASVGAQPGPPCTGTNHCVDITIAGSAIQSVPAVVVQGNNHQIYWRIKTAGYTFASPPQPIGIAFKQPSSINDNGHMPANEFPCNHMSTTLFHCTDANSTHGTGVHRYQYSITVMDPAGKPIALDPWIVNN